MDGLLDEAAGAGLDDPVDAARAVEQEEEADKRHEQGVREQREQREDVGGEFPQRVQGAERGIERVAAILGGRADSC